MTNQPHPTTPEHRAYALARIAERWAATPHQRLGQLISNLTVIAEHRSKVYYIRDLELMSDEVKKRRIK